MSRRTCGLARLGLLIALASLTGCPLIGNPPVLSINPLALSFGTEGTQNTFQIQNTGGGALNWTLSATEYDPPDEDGWLFFSQRVDGNTVPVESGTTTTEVDNVEVAAVRAGLSAGTHNATISVESTNGGGTVSIRVSLMVSAPGTLSVNPTTLNFGTAETRLLLTLTNEGTQDRNWAARVPASASWLTVRPADGRLAPGSVPVEVLVNRTGRTPGTYAAEITLISGALTIPVDVSMQVIDRLLVVDPLELDFGTSATEQTFSVRNAGALALDWQVDIAAPYSSYVSVDPVTGSATSETDTVTVSIDRIAAAFAYGSRNEVPITVTSDGGDAEVTLVVSVGVFSISPAQLDLGTAATQGTLTLDNHGTTPIDWTASEDTAWITQVTASGTAAAGGTSPIVVTVDRADLIPGHHEGAVTVQSGSQTETITVLLDIPPPPRLVVAPTTLDFRTDQVDKVVAIWNDGSGTVNWQLDSSAFPEWLSATFGGVNTQAQPVLDGALTGAATDTLRVSVSRVGLPPGLQTASFTISATDQDDAVLESRTLSISMGVAAEPILGVDTGGEVNQLTFGSETATLPMRIVNLGTDVLNWSIDPATLPAWMTIAPQPLEGVLEDNTQSRVLNVTVNRNGIDSGDYEQAVLVRGTRNNVTVTMRMTVPQPVLLLDPAALELGTTQTTGTARLSNAGGGMLDWKAGVDRDSSWLTIEPRQGISASGEERELTVTVNRSSVAPGDYEGIVEFQWNNGNRTRLHVLITVPGPVLSVAPASLTFGANDTGTTLTVTNTGERSRILTWSIVELPLPWATVDATVGTTTREADPVVVSINRSRMVQGTYTGNFRFTSNGGEQVIPVTMDVGPISVEPAPLVFGSIDDALTFRIENHLPGAAAWTITENLTWLSVAPEVGATSSGARSTVTATVSRAGLAAQTYQGEISVSVPAQGFEWTLPVSMRVAGFTLNPETVALGEIGEATNASFDVTNITASSMNVVAEVTSGSAWLEVAGAGVPSAVSPDGSVTMTVTANPANLSPGDYEGVVTITQGLDSDTVLVTITVPAPPYLAVSPATLNFGSIATDKLVAIWNSGVGTVNWNIDTAGFPSWLSVSGVSGSVPDLSADTDSIVVTVDRRNITPPASLAHDIIVTATDQDANPLDERRIHVGMSVAAVPLLSVETNPPAWDANAKPLLVLGDQATTGEFQVSNSGTGTLDWSIDKTGFPNWLSIVEPVAGSLPAGVDPARLHVRINRFGMENGDHSHEIVVASNGGDVSMRVVMTVPVPALRLNPESLSFGLDGTSGTFTISNTGGDVLEWSLEIPGGVTWFSAQHRDGGATSGATPVGVEETILVTVNRQGQQAGDHEAELRIGSNGGNKTLPISMTVPGPRLSVSPQTLVFAADDAARTLTVQNSGDATRTLVWSIDDYPHWLSFDIKRGAATAQPSVVTVTPNRSGLDAGSHEGDIEFSSNGGTRTVHVTLEVPQFTINPSSIEIDGRSTTASFMLENHGNASLDWSAFVSWPSWNTSTIDWIDIVPSSGVVPINARATLTVRVLDRTGLEPNWYEGPIVIRQNAPSGIDEILSARVRVAAFSVSDALIDVGTISTAETDTFDISANGSTPIDWQAAVSSGATWLELDQYSGTGLAGTQTITLTADPAGLAAGEYSGTITVTSGGDTESITVRMTVPRAPTLAAAPLSMDFGSATRERLLAIWDSGIGVVNWDIDTAGFPAWLTLSGASQGTVAGIETDTVTLRVDRTGLTPTATPYSYEFQITGTDGAAVPLQSLTARVEMTVAGVPVIDIDTGFVDQLGVDFVNLGTDLSEATFTIANIGTGVLTWNITVAEPPTWLVSISPVQGSIAPGRQNAVTLVVDRTNLTFGGYQATLTVGSNDIANRTVPVSVQLQIPKKVTIGLRGTNIDLDQVTTSSFFEVANTGDPGSVLDFYVETNKDWLFLFPLTGQSIGTANILKDWKNIDISIDRTKLEGTGSSAVITVHAYELDENMNIVALDDIIEPRQITLTVLAAPLSFEVPVAALHVPSVVRVPMLMRNLRYKAIALPEDQLGLYAPSFTVFESDVPIESSETNQFLKDGTHLRTDVAILLDYTGSMFDSAQLIADDPAFAEFAVNHPGDPLDKLQALYEYYVGRLIQGFPDHYRIALLEFHDRSNAIVQRPNLVHRFTTDKTALLDELRAISVQDHGATELLLQLISASSMLTNADFPYVPLGSPETSAYYVPFDTADVSALVLVSDGRVTTPPGKVKDVVDVMSAQRTRLFAIGWGESVNHEPLARVAAATGGHYYPTRPVPLTDGNGDPVYDANGNPIMLPTTDELSQYCLAIDACEPAIAPDLQTQVVFNYITLNEESGIKTRLAAAFDDPNDNDGACGLGDQRVIAGGFSQKLDFIAVVGDANLGQISMSTDGIQPDNSAAVMFRSEYMPRNIREFVIEVTAPEDFSFWRAGTDEGGLVWGWEVQPWNTVAGDWDPPLAQPDDIPSVPHPATTDPWLKLRISVADGTPLVFGDFGNLFQLVFDAVAGPFDLSLFVDNDVYIDPDPPVENKYFIYPNAIRVDPDGRRAPAFPAPMLTRIAPVHPADPINTFNLDTDEDALSFSIANIGGTYPYGTDYPTIALGWNLGTLPNFLSVPAGGIDDGILTAGVGDTDIVGLDADRDISTGIYYGTIPVEYSNGYGQGVAGLDVWIDVLPPVLEVTDENGAAVTLVNFGANLEEGGFYVLDTGQSSLTWSLRVEDNTRAPVDLAALADWLTVNKIGAVAKWSDPDPPFDPVAYPDTLRIEIDRVTAPVGPFTYWFLINAVDDRGEPVIGSPIEVQVTGNILPPALSITSIPLNFGALSSVETMTLSNTGNRILYWEVDPLTPLPAWVTTVNPANGTIQYWSPALTVDADVTINRGLLPVGAFAGSFKVYGYDGSVAGGLVQPIAGVTVNLSGTN